MFINTSRDAKCYSDIGSLTQAYWILSVNAQILLSASLALNITRTLLLICYSTQDSTLDHGKP